MPGIRVKICGLSEPDTLSAAVEAGADYVGFVFFGKSPRNVTPDIAGALAVRVPKTATKVALTVNADDAALDAIAEAGAVDLWQCHGRESPERVAEIKARYGLPVMKVVGVANTADLTGLAPYTDVADYLMVDAKAPKGAVLPGGNGVAFDWAILDGFTLSRPWMLAGGLSAESVAAAIQRTGASYVDVSSGVERAPGVKDAEKIRAFLKAAKAASPVAA